MEEGYFWTNIHACYHGVFQFGIFFSVDQSESMCIFIFCPSNPSNSFPILLIHSAFFYVLLVAIFCSKIILIPLHLVVGMSSCDLPLLADRIFFRCFGMSRFVYIVLPCLDIFLVFLLSPVLSGLFPRVLLSFSLGLIFLLLLFNPWEFFTSVLANGLSLEFERQQVSSSFQGSSQHSGRSQ